MKLSLMVLVIHASNQVGPNFLRKCSNQRGFGQANLYDKFTNHIPQVGIAREFYHTLKLKVVATRLILA